MKALRSVLTALALISPLIAQNPQPILQLQAVTGTAPVINASIAGAQGTTTAFYVLIANFTGGSIASNILTINNVPNTLSSSNYVSFIWGPVAGVNTYDLLKLASATLPSGSNSVACHTALSATTTGSSDQGCSLSSYTIASTPSNGVGQLILNARDHTSPLMEIDGANGLNPGLAFNGKVGDFLNANRTFTDATATGVTLAANKMVGGIYFHAPTGAVNDVTDTAAAIVAALPACYLNSTSVAGLNVGASFYFRLLNNSSGANTITVTAGTGVTLSGTMTVAQNNVRQFVGVVTNCATPAVTLYSLGTGAF